MSVTTDTSTSSSGSTTTVGTTVRNEGGGGGEGHEIDVFLKLDSSKLVHVSSGSPSPAPDKHDASTLSCWWMDYALEPYTELKITYRVKWRPGAAFKGAAGGHVVVFDRTDKKMWVHPICICPPSRSIGSLFTKETSKSGSTATLKTAKKWKRKKAVQRRRAGAR